MASFADRLKELHKTKATTQKAVADYLGVTEQAYQKYEYGMREPNHETTIKLAEYFDVSTDYLLGRKNYRVNEDGHLTIKVPPDFINWNTEEILAWYKKQAENKKSL